MDLYEAMRTTPATREFTDEPVPDAQLYRILEHARFAPSGGNRQPWHVIVVRDPERRRRLRELTVPGWREYMAQLEAGLVPFTPADGRRWAGPQIDLEVARTKPYPNPFFDGLEGVPVLLAVCADLRSITCLDLELDRTPIVPGSSVYPFCQNILLAARQEGLGGVLTTLVIRREAEAAPLLELPDHFAIAALMALGHPVRRLTKLGRKDVESFATIDRFWGEPLTAS